MMALSKDEPSRRVLKELSDALKSRINEATTASQELRDAVCEYVTAEQLRGTSLKDILATVKKLLAKTESVAGYSSDTMASQLMDWCLEFHSPPTPNPVGSPAA